MEGGVRRYYVYEHRERDTGRVFYVGKGFGNRASRTCDRNKYWKRVAEKHGFTYHLIYEGLTEEEALRIEVELISAYGRGNLCNLTDGGEGVSNPTKSVRIKQGLGQASKDVFTFYHDEHGKFTGTCFELKLQYNLSKSQSVNIREMVKNGRYRHIGGWRVTEKLKEQKPFYKPEIKDRRYHCLVHDSIGVAIGQRKELADMCEITTSQVSHLLIGRIKSCKGWRNG